MAKNVKTVWYCTECGGESPKWEGRCPFCGAWNSMVEEKVQPKNKGIVNTSRIGKSKPRVSALLELKVKFEKCKHPEIRAMWDASHDLELMIAYGNKHWGSRRRTA